MTAALFVLSPEIRLYLATMRLKFATGIFMRRHRVRL